FEQDEAVRCRWLRSGGRHRATDDVGGGFEEPKLFGLARHEGRRAEAEQPRRDRPWGAGSAVDERIAQRNLVARGPFWIDGERAARDRSRARVAFGAEGTPDAPGIAREFVPLPRAFRHEPRNEGAHLVRHARGNVRVGYVRALVKLEQLLV